MLQSVTLFISTASFTPLSCERFICFVLKPFEHYAFNALQGIAWSMGISFIGLTFLASVGTRFYLQNVPLHGSCNIFISSIPLAYSLPCFILHFIVVIISVTLHTAILVSIKMNALQHVPFPQICIRFVSIMLSLIVQQTTLVLLIVSDHDKLLVVQHWLAFVLPLNAVLNPTNNILSTRNFICT